MPGPLDMMIMRSVKCLTCGAGYGLCDCAGKHRQQREKDKAELVEAEYQRLMSLSDNDLIAETTAILGAKGNQMAKAAVKSKMKPAVKAKKPAAKPAARKTTKGKR